jgi:MYXO-CTERM domain-containing protein
VSGVASPATFSLTNTAGAPATVAVSSGNNQSTTVNTAFGAPLVVLVTDAFGNPVSGSNVVFSAPGSGPSASLTPSVATTNGSGVASATAVANGSAGTYTVAASALGASPAGFSLTNVACSFTLSPGGTPFDQNGGTGTVTVTASNPSCSWTATSNAPWITGVTPSGMGTGIVSYNVNPNLGVAREGTISIAGQTFIIDQANGCVVDIGTNNVNEPSTAGTDGVSVIASDGTCPWTATTTDPFLSVLTQVGTGTGSVSFAFTANPGAPRTGTITVAGHPLTVTQANGCTATLSPTGLSVPAAGGPAGFGVIMSDPTCTWTANSSAGFVTDLTISGIGSGTVSFSVSASTGPARSAAINVNGQTFTVSQADGCTYLLAPTGATSTAAGGDGSFVISASDPACAWTATSNDPFITGVTPNGTGDGTIVYSVGANVGPGRVGSISVGGRTFTITQANGCVATLDPTSTTVPGVGGDTSFSITLSDQTCMWTAGSTTSWAVVNTPSGTGNGTVSLTLGVNDGPSRSTTIEAGGQTFTLNQDSGCTVTLATANGAATAAGGDGTFNVAKPAGCAYTAVSTVPWITNVLVSATGASYTVQPSTDPIRTGTIVITSTTSAATATFTIKQSAGCIITLPTGGASPTAAGGSAFAAVTKGAGCGFTATTNTPWITGLRIDPTGVNYTVDANTGPARGGTIDVINTDTNEVTQFAVNQASGCTVALTTNQANVDKTGGNGSFSLTCGAGCTWTASAGVSWITGVVVTATGVSYTVAPNVDAQRTAVITVTAQGSGQQATFTVTQASGCAINLLVSSAELGINGGSASFDVVTGVGCTFTAVPDMSWTNGVSIAGSTVHLSVDQNTGVARTSTVTVTATDTGANATFSVQQSGPITPPQIGTQPSSVQAFVGDGFVVSVVASGGDLHYQWRKDGNAITGATAADYRIMQAALGDSGSYTVVITNAAGSVTSTAATVTITIRNVNIDGGAADGGTTDGGPAVDGGSHDGAIVTDSGAPDSDARVDGATAIDASADATGDGGVTTIDGGSSDGAIKSDGAVADAGDARAADAGDARAADAGRDAAKYDAALEIDADLGGGGPDDSSGCSCRVVSADRRDPSGAVALVALGVALFARRRRRTAR